MSYLLVSGLIMLTSVRGIFASKEVSRSLTSKTLTIADLATIKAELVTTFGLVPSYGTACNAKVSPCPIGDNIGALVRLTFHDAAGNGGPNGCIDFNTAANNGLQEVVETLDNLYYTKNFTTIISKADLYVLAGNVAIQYASTTTSQRGRQSLDPSPGPLILPFRYGRSDVISCDDSGFLPSASDAWSQLKTLFMGRFGFNIQESVAIMGAHSVGRCQYANSGFDGGWTAFQSSFSNEYFKTMGDVGWKNDNTSDVWTGVAQNLLLKVDAELLYDTYGSSRGYCNAFKNFASSNRCPIQGQSQEAFMAYANNVTGNIHFYGNFSTAWQKMTEYTFSGTNDARFLAEVGTALDSSYPVLVNAPTLAPTSTATVPPTTIPSATPAANPTMPPSSAPSNMPSTPPSKLPSSEPTTKPSKSPSAGPTAGSTEAPTVKPSTTPSVSPTKLPSTSPTLKPSSVPSAAPSKTPSTLPTAKPSTTPTTGPSKIPTVFPSPKPSNSATPTRGQRGLGVGKKSPSMRGSTVSTAVEVVAAMTRNDASSDITAVAAAADTGLARDGRDLGAQSQDSEGGKYQPFAGKATARNEDGANSLAIFLVKLRRLFANKH